MANEDYARGYNDGFRAGLEAGKGLKTPSLPPSLDPFKPRGHTCAMCGMFFETGKVYGYVCGHNHCPSRVTCTSTANTHWSSWMSGRPF